MAEPDLSLTPPIAPTPPGWIDAVAGDFDQFLKDHASCEKKASGMALAVASHYPDQPALLNAMVDLAVEELNHYREVIRLLLARNVAPGADQKDPYINELNQHVRRGAAHFLLDRLLMGAIVERRGAERFALIADFLDTHLPGDTHLSEDTHLSGHLTGDTRLSRDTHLAAGDTQKPPHWAQGATGGDFDPALVRFYRAIAASEHRHWELFYQLAWQHCAQDQIERRFAELTAVEADIMLRQPLRAALH